MSGDLVIIGRYSPAKNSIILCQADCSEIVQVFKLPSIVRLLIASVIFILMYLAMRNTCRIVGPLVLNTAGQLAIIFDYEIFEPIEEWASILHF